MLKRPSFVALTSLLLFCGCTSPWQKKPQAAPPPQAQAPSQEPAQQESVIKLPKPEPAPDLPPVKEQGPAPEEKAAEPEPVHRKKPKPSPSTPEPSQPTAAASSAPAPAAAVPSQQVASAEPPATASAIGQLSEGGSASSGNLRGETMTLISNVDRKLREITRPLSATEEKTAAQVRKFLQQARDAMQSQDVDAAHTLATKANVLLEELLSGR